MTNMDDYSVYTTEEGQHIMRGTFAEVEDYVDKTGYTVVCNYTGYFVSEC